MKLAFGLALALLSGCSFGPSANQKAEAGRISRAVDLLRQASNAQKPELFAALQSAPCETSELCELKQICSAGYGMHLGGLSETARAKALLANGGTDAAVNQALDAAKNALSQAAPQLAKCADAQGAVQRKYKL